jgi:hypothetical protein
MSTAPATGTGAHAPDLLESAAVRVPCAACGEHYEISLRKVLLSQRMMHDGCPVHTETECSPVFNAPLADGDAVRDLERSWSRLSTLLRDRGLELTLRP